MPLEVELPVPAVEVVRLGPQRDPLEGAAGAAGGAAAGGLAGAGVGAAGLLAAGFLVPLLAAGFGAAGLGATASTTQTVSVSDSRVR